MNQKNDKHDIVNSALTLASIPAAKAGLQAIWAFALTFNGYEASGGFRKCGNIANERKESTLTELRTCLFFEQRRWRHFGERPTPVQQVYIRDLIRKIRVKVRAGKASI